MRLFEFADAESQIALWKLISDSVWAAMSQEREQQARAVAQKPKSSPRPKKAKRVKVPSPPKLKIAKTPPPKLPVKASAATRQAANQQQLPKPFTNTARSNAETPIPKMSSAATVPQKNAANAQSVAQTQRQLYPLANDETVKRLTK